MQMAKPSNTHTRDTVTASGSSYRVAFGRIEFCFKLCKLIAVLPYQHVVIMIRKPQKWGFFYNSIQNLKSAKNLS